MFSALLSSAAVCTAGCVHVPSIWRLPAASVLHRSYVGKSERHRGLSGGRGKGSGMRRAPCWSKFRETKSQREQSQCESKPTLYTKSNTNPSVAADWLRGAEGEAERAVRFFKQAPLDHQSIHRQKPELSQGHATRFTYIRPFPRTHRRHATRARRHANTHALTGTRARAEMLTRRP